MSISVLHLCLFFFNDTATTEIYTLSLHDALPIYPTGKVNVFIGANPHGQGEETTFAQIVAEEIGVDVNDVKIIQDRKSTRLNSSHPSISYAVFCLKKKKKKQHKPHDINSKNYYYS